MKTRCIKWRTISLIVFSKFDVKCECGCARGQVYGFVRFMNVKNRDKLGQALNNIWIGDCRVWAREARFDRFAQFDEVDRFDRNDGSGVGKDVVVIT